MPRPRPPESFLRHIWKHLLFNRDGLSTTDGAPVTVLAPGDLNTDGGPDFRDARVRIGGIEYLGDVELHSDGASWHTHNHSEDPHYNRVILHVVFAADAATPPATTSTGRKIPLLILQPFLDPGVSLSGPGNSPSTASPPLPCTPYNDTVPGDLIRSWLRALARERLELRVRDLHGRLCELIDETRGAAREPFKRYHGDPGEIPPPRSGYTRSEYAMHSVWEQLLYENLLEGMGYRNNRAPFRALAQSVRLADLKRFDLQDTPTMQAILFGAAGLLPVPRTLAARESRAAVHALRRRWKEIRPALRIPLLHEADWLFFRLRPSNFPTARIASFACCLPSLFGPGALRALIALFSGEPPSPRALRGGVAALFRFTPDAYWSCHRHFRSTGPGGGIAIGRERVADCTVTVLIPFVMLYARIFTSVPAYRGAHTLLDALPPPRWNAVTRAVRAGLLKERVPLTTACEHQGALQLHRVYCMQGRCGECRVGKYLGR
jgi:hypothetical protein